MAEQVTTLVAEDSEKELTPREQLEQAYDDLNAAVGDDHTTARLFLHAMEIVKARVLSNDNTYTRGIDAEAAVAQVLATEQDIDKELAEKFSKLIDSKVVFDASPEEI